MSRCLSCGLSFREDNGWQDYCSPDCLYDSMVRNVRGPQRTKAQAKFKSMLEDPKQCRRIRFDKGRAVPPKIGGGWKLTVRPMTLQDYTSIAIWRGRGFSDCYHGNNSNNLPSQGGYDCPELLNEGDEQPLTLWSNL